MADDLRPMGEAAWARHAALVNARLARFQLHNDPDWLYAVCRSCGFELEQNPPSDVPAFRYAVTSHDCPPPAPGPEPDPEPERLF